MLRRTFLKTSLAAIGTAAVSRAGVAPRGLKIFACDWTLQKTCSPDAFPLAARIGLDGVQVDFGRVKDGVARPPLFDEAHQDRILAAAAEHRVAIASLALGVLNSVPLKCDEAAKQWANSVDRGRVGDDVVRARLASTLAGAAALVAENGQLALTGTTDLLVGVLDIRHR